MYVSTKKRTVSNLKKGRHWINQPAVGRSSRLQEHLHLALAAVHGFDPGGIEPQFVRGMLSGFLQRAFRKSVSDETIESYLTIATRHWDDRHSYEEGMHLLFRNILISPRFLYRCLDPAPGVMDDFDRATRLSYFLTQGPPDETLIDLAQRGRLSAVKPSKTDPSKLDYRVLRREAERLMPTVHTAPMIQSFVGQWLDTNSLHGIMPDPKFNFETASIDIARYETERFFTEILTKNLPMTDFIDPDFTFSSVGFVQRNYGFTPLKLQGKKLSGAASRKLQRLEIERRGRYGGLLGQSSILMATANGVDTHPVIRGVWVLENILGMPPPAPPKNVPALTPDTQGTTTPREMLAAHTKDSACAGFHQRIDPIGFVLENYDPVGRWRTEWPGTEAKIDASGTLPDGTEIKNAIDFKAWLVDNINLFSECLAEKLMIYATGRIPNYAEKREIEEIVKKNHERGNGFRELILALIESKTFRTL